jgi:acetyltransferase-like isoleucine patch superfamily enzyme
MITDAFNTPWKVWNRIGSLISFPYVRLMFLLNGVKWGSGWSFYGAPIIQKHLHSKMSFGVGLQLRSSPQSNPLGINHPVILATLNRNAQLIIGDHFAMSGGCICVAEKVMIGNNVAVGANTTIVDTDFHPLSSSLRAINPQDAETKPVIIKDEVFIGMYCLILKGITIGKGSVIGAGSIVAKDVPPGVIVAGNPARIIREIEGHQ